MGKLILEQRFLLLEDGNYEGDAWCLCLFELANQSDLQLRVLPRDAEAKASSGGRLGLYKVGVTHGAMV